MVYKSQFPESIPSADYKDLVSNFFWHQLDKFQDRVLFVNLPDKNREWTGKEIKSTSERLAKNLIDVLGVKPNDDCVFFYKNCDYIQLTSLACLFAGASVCVGEPEDVKREKEYMVDLMQPSVVFIPWLLTEQIVSLRKKLGIHFKVVVMDDDIYQRIDFSLLDQVYGLHKQLLVEPRQDFQVSLPIQVAPERPAFVLLSSGSTGLPKAVNRSQRNSLYVCFSLNEQSTKHVWDLNENSVMAGHLQLDHGTGTFCLKMTLAKGLKLIIMERYEYKVLLDAIAKYQISDVLLGSAFLHNFISDQMDYLTKEGKEINDGLISLRNFIAVGSPIASRDLANQFMVKYPQCSVRQAFGSTECGFMSIVEYERAKDAQDVGPLLPNLMIKLIGRGIDYDNNPTLSMPAAVKDNQLSQQNDDDRKRQKGEEEQEEEEGKEVEQFNQVGELFVSGPTVSPGYMQRPHKPTPSDAFLPDGYYKSADMCMMVKSDDSAVPAVERLKILGRYSEVLCLHDGWKVLPSEIERVIMEHPQVQEAAVVGVPHPELPTCHAPRAYVVLRKGSESLSEKELFDFVASRCSEPKQLVGGIKFMQALPRISIGKVDKKLLTQQDSKTAASKTEK